MQKRRKKKKKKKKRRAWRKMPDSGSKDSVNGSACPSTIPLVPGSKTPSRRADSVFPSASVYISQNQIGSKVHSLNSPSSSKEVRTGNTLTDRTMQSLVSDILLLFSNLSLGE